MDLSKEIMKGRSSKQQRQAVSGVLGSLMPPQASARFRRWFPVSKVRLSPSQLSWHLLSQDPGTLSPPQASALSGDRSPSAGVCCCFCCCKIFADQVISAVARRTR